LLLPIYLTLIVSV
ncbi:hypothetical protein CI238_05137, partial [Colletotrichum incanum]